MTSTEKPRAVWRRDGSMTVVRQSPRTNLAEGLEVFEVPAWVARHIYSMGERELVSDAQRAAFERAYTKHVAADERRATVERIREEAEVISWTGHDIIAGLHKWHLDFLAFLDDEAAGRNPLAYDNVNV